MNVTFNKQTKEVFSTTEQRIVPLDGYAVWEMDESLLTEKSIEVEHIEPDGTVTTEYFPGTAKMPTTVDKVKKAYKSEVKCLSDVAKTKFTHLGVEYPLTSSDEMSNIGLGVMAQNAKINNDTTWVGTRFSTDGSVHTFSAGEFIEFGKTVESHLIAVATALATDIAAIESKTTANEIYALAGI